MWTLLSQSKKLTTGIFPSREIAQKWATVYVPELEMETVELLLPKVQEGAFVQFELCTNHMIDDPLNAAGLPVC